MLHEHCPDTLTAHNFIHVQLGDPAEGKVDHIVLILSLLDDPDHKPKDRWAIDSDSEFPTMLADFLQVLVKNDCFISRCMPHPAERIERNKLAEKFIEQFDKLFAILRLVITQRY